MRLTNYIRDAFVRSVMNDVPQVDYDEQAQKLAMDTIKKSFAEVFPGINYDRAGESGWLERCNLCMPDNLRNVYTYGPGYNFLERTRPAVWKELKEISALAQAQTNARSKLEGSIRGCAYSVNTRKALVAALPEFEKYLPEDDAKAIRTLPVVQNVVADFIKAGWPKEKVQLEEAMA